MKFQTVPRNEKGRDFVIGDIHGEFPRVRELLDEVQFNEETDRLFSVGDLVDRGPNSVDALEWLEKPWFFAISGNHEQMTCDAATGRPADMVFHSSHGGAWFGNLTTKERNKYAYEFNRLPLAMEVQVGDKLCGLIHAEPLVLDWDQQRWVMSDHPDVKALHRVQAINFALWARDRITLTDPKRVENVDVIFVGHTPVRAPTWKANVYYIDTGGCFGRPLTMVQMDTMEVFQSLPPPKAVATYRDDF